MKKQCMAISGSNPGISEYVDASSKLLEQPNQ
jgi:hypothetical protein